jgi:hypothetical protein
MNKLQRLHIVLTVVLALSLIASLVLRRSTQRDLQQEVHTLRDANSVLRQTLGDLTVSVSQKDQQIDELQTSCEAKDKVPDSLHIPLPLRPEPPRLPATVPFGAN